MNEMDPSPEEVVVILDWPKVEKRYYFSAPRAAEGILGYFHANSRTLVYRLDHDATAALQGLSEEHHRELAGELHSKARFKSAKDAFTRAIHLAIRGL